MINLVAGILSHPAREAMKDVLLTSLGSQSEHEVWVFTDLGLGYWPNARRAWQELVQRNEDATHCLLLQDDVTPCLDLLLGLRIALQNRPADIVSLFSASQKIARANAEGYAWAIGKSLSWSQGIVLPREIIGPWINWTDLHCQPNIRSHDARLSVFLLMAQIPVLYTVPCLVEHDCPENSLIGNSRGPHIRRVAGYFPGEQWSALSQDWSAGAENPFKLTTPGKSAYGGVVKQESPFAKEFGSNG